MRQCDANSNQPCDALRACSCRLSLREVRIEGARLELHHIGNRQDRSAFNAMVLCTLCHAKLHADPRLKAYARIDGLR
jgi:hypothetical protein